MNDETSKLRDDLRDLIAPCAFAAMRVSSFALYRGSLSLIHFSTHASTAPSTAILFPPTPPTINCWSQICYIPPLG